MYPATTLDTILWEAVDGTVLQRDANCISEIESYSQFNGEIYSEVTIPHYHQTHSRLNLPQTTLNPEGFGPYSSSMIVSLKQPPGGIPYV